MRLSTTKLEKKCRYDFTFPRSIRFLLMAFDIRVHGDFSELFDDDF